MNYLEELKQLNLEKEDYAIIGSSAMAIRGLRVNEDLDIIVKKKLLTAIKKKFPIIERKFTYKIKNTHVEIWKSCPGIANLEKLITDSEYINSYPFVKLKYILQYKKSSNKIKDLEDIKLIDDYKKSKDIRQKNKNWWNEVTPIHINSPEVYKINELKKGNITLHKIELREIGNIRNKNILHLQCHIGLDSLSLAMLGAKVTAVDISEKAIEQAQKLNKKLKQNVKFIASDIFDLPLILNEKFDIVFTSYGILPWLYNLKVWSGIINGFLKTGGYFYIVDFHPMAYVIDCDEESNVIFEQLYFSNNNKPEIWKEEKDYANSRYISKNPIYTWKWTIGDLISSIANNNFHLNFYHEFGSSPEKIIDNMVQDIDKNWVVPTIERKIPLLFSLMAKKEVN